jgi:hypothetical protein
MGMRHHTAYGMKRYLVPSPLPVWYKVLSPFVFSWCYASLVLDHIIPNLIFEARHTKELGAPFIGTFYFSMRLMSANFVPRTKGYDMFGI